jgi:hypothetical protein
MINGYRYWQQKSRQKLDSAVQNSMVDDVSFRNFIESVD